MESLIPAEALSGSMWGTTSCFKTSMAPLRVLIEFRHLPRRNVSVLKENHTYSRHINGTDQTFKLLDMPKDYGFQNS
jgi:hypothetical protein